MLVELFALSGAGKSTVVEAFAKQARVTTRKDLSAEWADTPVLQRLAYIGRAFANYRRLAAASRFAAGTSLDSGESHFRLMRLVAKTDWLKSRSGVVLLDQGFLQDVWSILLSSKAARAEAALLCSLIRPLYEGIDATIVVLDVDNETASARVMARTNGESRFDRMPEAQLRRSIEAASELQRQIVEAARHAGLPVLVIDGSPPAEVVTDRLLALLPAARSANGAEPTLRRPRRVSVVGATGSGKTVLAKQIAERLNLPHCELDQLRRHAASSGSSEQTFDGRVAQLALSDEWVIDGHYRGVRHLVWSRAEVVVWLNYPLHLVALRLIRRFVRKRSAGVCGMDRLAVEAGPARPVADEGSSWKRRFFRLIRTLRERRDYRRLLQPAHYPDVKTIEFRSLKATRQWLRNL